MGGLFSSKEPRTPIKGVGTRFRNLYRKHFRGLIGFFVPLIVLTPFGEYGQNQTTVLCVWLWMAWLYAWQPVPVPIVGLVPVFVFPMAGVMNTVSVVKCYFNENIALFILGGMLVLLWNNSGLDRRIALRLLTSGDACQFSAKRIIFKSCTAAWFLSMFSNRLIVSSFMIQYVTPVFHDLQSSTSRASEPDYNEIKYIVNSAIQTSCGIGSIGILYNSYAVLAFRALFADEMNKMEYPDIFNFLQYSCFAIPVSIVMYALNTAYHMLLINCVVKKPMSESSMKRAHAAIKKYTNTVAKNITLHEYMTLFFKILILVLLFLRWSAYFGIMKDENRELTSPEIPYVKDCTIAAFFVVLLHCLPKGFNFLKVLTAKKKSDLPPLKPESAILWWRYVDKNTNYGYMFVIGSGVCLVKAIFVSGLYTDVAYNYGKPYTEHEFMVSLLLVILTAALLCNVLTGVAACIIFLPFVIHMAYEAPPPEGEFLKTEWVHKMFLGALGVGIMTSLGFLFPFLYTPAFFCRKNGKVPVRKMVKYGFVSTVICAIVLWVSLVWFAPVIWGDSVLRVAAPQVGTPKPTPAPPPP